MATSWEPSASFDEWQGCLGCVHYRAMKCVAYPRGIPLPILSGEVDHMVVRPGQVGDTTFGPIDVREWRRTGRRVPAATPTGKSVQGKLVRTPRRA